MFNTLKLPNPFPKFLHHFAFPVERYESSSRSTSLAAFVIVNELFDFSVWSCKSYLYILGKGPLLVILLQIFFLPVCALLFIYLMLSLRGQKFSMLTKHILIFLSISTFSFTVHVFYVLFMQPLLNPRLQRFSYISMLASRGFIAFALTFMSIMWFHLVSL